MLNRRRLYFVLSCLVGLEGCSHARPQPPSPLADRARDIPEWVTGERVVATQLCGMGVAGAGFDKESPYPRQLSKERALANLVGILGTQVQEAIIDQVSAAGNDVQLQRLLHIDAALLQQVTQIATVEYWLDSAAVGPYAQKDFTYAHACLSDGDVQGAFKLDPQRIKNQVELTRVSPQVIPKWLTLTGKQPGGRICATGFSLPTFFADKTFDSVVDDVRGQLAQVVQTLVASYAVDLARDQAVLAEQMTVATTDAVAKGVIVTHYWHDRDGRGPYRKKQTTYGWGCVYPVDVVAETFAAVAKQAPAEVQHVVDAVKSRAAQAFADLAQNEQQAASHQP